MSENGLSENAKVEIRRLMAQFPHRQSALLGALFVAQDEAGYLTADALADLAAVMDLPVSEVASVASFYHLLFFRPVGRHLVQVCTNIACMLNGCGRILDQLRRQLGVEVGETTPDGAFTLKTAECLAACGAAAAPGSPPGASGSLSPKIPRSPNTSSSTPTKASPGPSKIARCWNATRTGSSRESSSPATPSARTWRLFTCGGSSTGRGRCWTGCWRRPPPRGWWAVTLPAAGTISPSCWAPVPARTSPAKRPRCWSRLRAAGRCRA